MATTTQVNPATVAQLPALSMFQQTPAYQLPDGTVVFGLRLPSVLPSNTDRAFTVNGATQNRLDLIAATFVQADAGWWAVADASNLLDPLAGVTQGVQLRIPQASQLPA